MRKKNKRARLIKIFLLGGVLFALFLILVVSTVGRQEFNASHKISLELIGRAQAATTDVTDYFKSVWTDYVALWGVREENKRLREELANCRAARNEYREAVATNIRLTKLLALKESLPPPVLTARIVGKDPSLWFKTVIVDRGSADGVKKGMPAVTVEGIVGQVLDTSPQFSKILLATDPNSAIDVLIQPSRIQGIVKGRNDDGLELQYVLKNCDVRKGDQIITSGLGGVFPKGLPVGTVSKAVRDRRGMFQKIEVAPAVDFNGLEHLLIIMKENSLAE
ncbi:MAG: rod shape-determining protein MreC [Desulfobacteraceae bacterium]|nr:rod shape-determining protein MreC [Desulfobacteraceae bacterium]